MVLPLRLIGLGAVGLAIYACAPSSGTSTEPDGDATAGAEAGGSLAPVEVEPEGSASSEGGESEADGEAPEEYSAVDLVLKLWPGECLLVAESEGTRLEHRFDFPGECHFVTTQAGETRAIKTDMGLALMVESSKQLEQDCDTALRVIVLGPAGPRLSRAVERVQMCAPGGWDDMMFHVLASEPVAFGTAGGEP